jgi:hypothetical protein
MSNYLGGCGCEGGEETDYATTGAYEGGYTGGAPYICYNMNEDPVNLYTNSMYKKIFIAILILLVLKALVMASTNKNSALNTFMDLCLTGTWGFLVLFWLHNRFADKPMFYNRNDAGEGVHTDF